MEPDVWWAEFVEITRELISSASSTRVVGVGVSGMGPCVAIADERGRAIRPAILYGVDVRATDQIDRLTEMLGAGAIVDRCGSSLSTQAAGPKLAWLAEHEPVHMEQASRFFMPSSWLAHRLTDSYVLDHHSASQCTPMYDTEAKAWYRPWAAVVAPGIDLPELVWPGDVVGHVTAQASEQTGIPTGVPVIGGTIDAWSEAISVGAQEPGDLMIMYGTTMFLINTRRTRATSSVMWGTVGAIPDTYNLAGGMATSGAITSWIRDLVGGPDFAELMSEAERSGPGARGLLMLPYFAGERTPIADPLARGVIAGLTLEHTRGDLYRAALEATAFGVRHNIQALRDAGGHPDRVVAVGGGTRGGLWTQIVSDVTGRAQELRTVTIGASFGAAILAAKASGAEAAIDTWNPIARIVQPDTEVRAHYDERFRDYLQLYWSTAETVHRLSRM